MNVSSAGAQAEPERTATPLPVRLASLPATTLVPLVEVVAVVVMAAPEPPVPLEASQAAHEVLLIPSLLPLPMVVDTNKCGVSCSNKTN
jgi:hypothetical protein